MLDVMSGGRLVAGFPVGTPMDTAYCYGANPATLRDKYREGVELIVRAWKEREAVRVQRQVHPAALRQSVAACRSRSRTRRSGSRAAAVVETWEWCIKNDFLYAYLSYFGYMAGISVMDGYLGNGRAAAAAELNPYRCAFLQFIGVADNDAEAERLYAEPAQYFYNRCFHLDPGFVRPPGYTSIATIRKGIQRPGADGGTQGAGPGPDMEGDRRQRLHRRRHPADGRRPAQRHGRPHEGRTRHAAHALRQHAARDRALQHDALCQGGDAEAAPPLQRVRGQVVAEGYSERDPDAGASGSGMSCRFAWSEAYQQFHTQAKSRANSAAAAVLRLTVGRRCSA